MIQSARTLAKTETVTGQMVIQNDPNLANPLRRGSLALFSQSLTAVKRISDINSFDYRQRLSHSQVTRLKFLPHKYLVTYCKAHRHTSCSCEGVLSHRETVVDRFLCVAVTIKRNAQRENGFPVAHGLSL